MRSISRRRGADNHLDDERLGKRNCVFCGQRNLFRVIDDSVNIERISGECGLAPGTVWNAHNSPSEPDPPTDCQKLRRLGHVNFTIGIYSVNGFANRLKLAGGGSYAALVGHWESLSGLNHRLMDRLGSMGREGTKRQRKSQ